MFSIDHTILLFSALLLIGVLTTKFSNRMGLPSLVFFIGVGMGFSKLVYFDNVPLTQLFGIMALIIILFEGGLQTKWREVKSVMAPSISLATIGVVVTTAVVGVCAKYILDVSWLEGMLFGAIVGSTDAAAVFAVLGSKNINRRLTSTLEAESGTNDPMAVFLTISFIQLISIPEAGIFTLIGNFFVQMGLGLLLGLVFGKAAVWCINRINLDSSGLYPVLAMAFAILTYSATALLNGSGLLAVYVMAVLVGNSDLTYRHSIFRFNEGFAWMMQILMFILLGLLVFPSQLPEIIWQGLALSFLLMLVARPIGVFVSTMFTRFTNKEKVLISWAGLRGAVPIVLATYPLMAGLENGQLFFNVVFFVVLTSALIQGATISPLARWLKLEEGKKAVVPHSLELVSIGKTNIEMIELQVEEQSFSDGKQIIEMNMPSEFLINIIIRGDKLITPRGNTVLLAGDTLYILGPKGKNEKLKTLFYRETGSSIEA